jgi:HlyD family secretion protein
MNVHSKFTPTPDVTETLGLDRSPARRWLSRGNLILGSILVLAIVGGSIVLYRHYGSTAGSITYTTEATRRGGLTETVTATGTVQPTNKVEISSELSGTVKEVKVDYNDRVVTGEVLVELNTDRLTAELQHSRASLAVKAAQLQVAEATLAEAKQANDRTIALTAKDYASQAARDTAQATYQRALASVAVARADVDVAAADLSADETNLKKATIRSPIDGVVLSRTIEPGQTVAASLQAPVLFTLAENLASMQLEVDVDEADVGTVRTGQSATFTVEAYRDRSFQAKVEQVRFASATINNVVTYTAVLSLDNSELLLRPGMTATADITVNHIEDALLIPNAALRFTPPEAAATAPTRGGILSMLMPRPPRNAGVAKVEATADGERSVYILENDAPKKVSVKIGASDGTWTEVTGGALEASALVITDSTTVK